MISEGAEGQTLKELYDVFKFPTDRDLVRKAFDMSLKRLSGPNPTNEPQFKTWFYIYKNNSVLQAYKDVLAQSYGVEVRDIERNDYNFDEPKTSLGSIVDEEEEIIEESNGDELAITEQAPANNSNSKDIVDFEVLKIKSALPVEDELRTDTGISTKYDEVDDDNPKFDKNIDDKEYVDPTKIKEELAKKKLEAMNEVVADTELSGSKVKLAADVDVTKTQPEKISLPLKKLGLDDEQEVLQAVESQGSRRKFNVRRSFRTGDIASALSGNSLVGRKANAKADDTEVNESKMLLFNGLYYRGSWETPFQQLRTEKSTFFTNTDEKPVMMMRSRGNFGVGKDDQLDAKFIELPYNNSRYSLLLMVPNTKDGLKELIKNFNPDTLSTVQKSLVQMPVQISIPKFRIDTTSRAEKSLAKLGLITMFTSKADLSGITREQKIHVDELVQHVSIRVDEGSSSENALSATNTIEAKTIDDDQELFIADKPFLFFVRDIVDDIVIVAGKITDIPYAE
ncbi:serine protease inhibitor 88Ea [Anopheles ziemanni]|uniref:serine protease inhibitor 88Ea n=1 Tax=Anopheles coustani TaxID=139045 RepID=UPI00265AD21D|nr:serine protease inhibitor 88Ea [Anopheles coustani]XP_058170954.1 serine protease inhibitor 88Ea [Anopheles ziemanni]